MQEKTIKAIDNSQRLQSKSFAYTAVDGRVYQTEEKLPSTTPNFKDFYKRLGHGFPSLIEIFRCDHYLSGRGIYWKSYVPAKEKDRLLADLDLNFNQSMRRYTMSLDGIWVYFQAKYPEKLQSERITSYTELVYRATHLR